MASLAFIYRWNMTSWFGGRIHSTAINVTARTLSRRAFKNTIDVTSFTSRYGMFTG